MQDKKELGCHCCMLEIGWPPVLPQNASPWTEAELVNFGLDKCLIGKAKGEALGAPLKALVALALVPCLPSCIS